MTNEPKPVVCTLTTKELASQALEWRTLHEQLIESTLSSGVATMTFPAGLAAAVEDLARREASCCAFLDIDTTVAGDVVRVVISSDNPDAVPVIRMLAGQS